MTIPSPFRKKTKDEPVLNELTQGLVSIQDVIAPSAIEVDFDYIKIENNYFRTLFASGYPRFVGANWLSPLITFDHTLDIAFFYYPVQSKGVLDDLRRKIAEMEATIQTDLERGRVVDPAVQAALDDAKALQEQLVKGIERFFRFSFYITIPATSLEELNSVTKRVEATLGSLLVLTKHATLQMEEAFHSTIPTCLDKLTITRNMDTTSLATTFPFTSSELTANEGILYGINEHNGSLIIFDRFSLENANSVLFAKSGAGKTLGGDTNVLIKDQEGTVKQTELGPLVEELIKERGATRIDEEIEGVLLPGVEVFTFNNELKGEWSKVTVAARKIPPRDLYKFTTKSGRRITTTGDHNMLILERGKIVTKRGSEVEAGQYVPLTSTLPEPSNPSTYVDFPFGADQIKSLPISDQFLRILGLFTSEGCIYKETSVRIFNTEGEILDLLKDGLKTLKIPYSPLKRHGREIGINIRSRFLKTFLDRQGAGGNASSKRVPQFLFNTPHEMVSMYLRAYYEGDGGVENHEVNVTSKSKELISDIAYLLLRFGIVARIRRKWKRATNSNHKGDYYYQLAISGADNIKNFAENVGFISDRKNRKLKKLLNKAGNTNVDIIPTLKPIFNEIYEVLYSSPEVPSPQNLSPLKRGVFSPSRTEVKKLIRAVEARISELGTLEKSLASLNTLPRLQQIRMFGTADKEANRLLWTELGESWRLMKNNAIQVGTVTALRAINVITKEAHNYREIKKEIRAAFDTLGLSIKEYKPSLRGPLVDRPNGDTSYETLRETVSYLHRKCREVLVKAAELKEKLDYLKTLADSDLFWDPIVDIKKIKCKDKYVYDLTVDNEIFLAGFGGMFVHNSYLVKLEALRSLMFGTEVIVIDPEAEYETLCQAIGGEYISFSQKSRAKINPFDLAGIYEADENALGLKILSLHTLFKIIFKEMTSGEEAVLDRALILTYKMKGITPDPETQTKEPPIMEDLYKVLLGMEEVEAKALADKLEKYIKGSLVGIFDQRSNVDIRNTFTAFSVRDLEDTLRPTAIYIILDFIWNRIKRDLKKRLLIIDEAWYLMRYPDSATFIYSIAKRARKYYLGLTTVTQDVQDFLATDYGKAIVTNSSVQILLKQHPAAIDQLAETFYLSEGEKHLLLSCSIGEGLFFAGSNHVAIQVVASEEEHQLITSNPEELAKRRELKRLAIEREKEVA